MKRELKVNREKLQKLNGYDEVMDFIEVNLMRFSGFKAIITLWEELKNKYEKEIS